MIGLDAREGFRSQRLIAEGGLPQARQRARNCGEHLRGRIGLLPFGNQQGETAVLYNEIAAFRPAARGPAEKAVAVSRRKGTRAEAQEGHQFASTKDVDPQIIPHRMTAPNVMALIQKPVKRF